MPTLRCYGVYGAAFDDNKNSREIVKTARTNDFTQEINNLSRNSTNDIVPQNGKFANNPQNQSEAKTRRENIRYEPIKQEQKKNEI